MINKERLERIAEQTPQDVHTALIKQKLDDIKNDIEQLPKHVEKGESNKEELEQIHAMLSVLLKETLEEDEKKSFNFKVRRDRTGLITEIYATEDTYEDHVEQPATIETLAKTLYANKKEGG